jgi:hypothetical protein
VCSSTTLSIFKDLAVGGLVELVVQRPHVIGMLGGQSTAGVVEGMGPAEPAQLLTEGSVVVRLGWLVALGGAVLADNPAGQPLGEAQHALQAVTPATFGWSRAGSPPVAPCVTPEAQVSTARSSRCSRAGSARMSIVWILRLWMVKAITVTGRSCEETTIPGAPFTRASRACPACLE